MLRVELKDGPALQQKLTACLTDLNGLVTGMVEDDHWYPKYIIEDLVAIYSTLDDAVDEHFLVKEL